MLRVLLTIGIGGPVFGGLFAWYGLQEREVAQASSQAPETIPLSKLIARGPDGNANIVLTDFVMIRDHAVERGRRGRWSGAWVPIVPRDDGPPGGSPRAIKAFVYSSKASNPDEVYQRVSTPQLAGLVINKIKTPKSGVKDHFEEQYPQTDFSNCIYIHEGREPTSETTAALMIFGGFAAVAIGIACLGLALVVWRKKKAQEAQQKRDRRKRRSRDSDDEEDDRPRKRRVTSRDDEDDWPRKRRVSEDDEDDATPRRRRPSEDDEDEPPRKRRPVARDDDEDDRPRRRRPADEDDDRPRKRPRRDDD